MLPAFIELFPSAPIGFFGIRRDEKTAKPHLYYENLPKISFHDWVFLIDPMLATGGSATLALAKLKESGASLSQTMLISIVAARQGADQIRKNFPEVILITAAIDPALNDRKFIVPGLGDFGDRYFGT
jgi:uracil phosphoribosyltransferase